MMKIADYKPIPVPEANIKTWTFYYGSWYGVDDKGYDRIAVHKHDLNERLQNKSVKENLGRFNLEQRNGWTWDQVVTKAFNLNKNSVRDLFGLLKEKPTKDGVQAPSVTSPKIRCPQIADRLVDTPRPFKGKPWRDICRKFPQGSFYGWECDVPTHNSTTTVWAKHLPAIQKMGDAAGYVDMITQCFFVPPTSETVHKAVIPGPHGDDEYAELEMVAARVTQGHVKPK